MSHAAHLWLFFTLVFGVVILPGLDMAFVLGSALVGGRRAGLSAVAGLMAGGICHTAMAAAGLAVVLKLVPMAFNAVLLVGGLYVGYVGLSLWRSAGAFAVGSSRPRAPFQAFYRALLTNLSNPKAYVFMLAVFPQFVRPEDGALPAQALVLGVIILATQASVYGPMAWLAGNVGGWIEAHPNANRGIARTVGSVLVLVAALTLLEGWRAV
jgi:threonine/homoserine/homoserine lactone efflux protein